MKRTHTVSLRMPEKLFEEISAMAYKEHRAVSQQIVYYVEKGMEVSLGVKEELNGEARGSGNI